LLPRGLKLLFNLERPNKTDMDQETIEDLIKIFQTFGDEKQKEVIEKVAKDDRAAATFLERIRRMQKRGEKIRNITDKIEDKFS
jgi:hypothetical protein